MSHHSLTRSHHHQHPLYPAERIGACSERAMDTSTFAVVEADMQRREAEYRRFLALRETPEYQQALASRLARKAGGQ